MYLNNQAKRKMFIKWNYSGKQLLFNLQIIVWSKLLFKILAQKVRKGTVALGLIALMLWTNLMRQLESKKIPHICKKEI